MRAQKGHYQALSTGREFGITPVRGIRAFAVDSEGRLIGLTEYPYEPGENVARCSLSAAIGSASHGGLSNLSSYLISRAPELLGRDHEMSNCSCGFYAYHDGVSDFPLARELITDLQVARDRTRTPVTVHGVIEGYGKVTIGERGFRAEKSRVLALAIPEPPPLPEQPPKYEATPFVLSVQQRWLTGVVALVAAIFGYLMLTAVVDFSPVIGLLVAVAAGVYGTVATVDALRGSHRDAASEARHANQIAWVYYQIDLAKCMADRADALDPALVEKIRQRYPEVAVLPSMDALLAEFPPDRAPTGPAQAEEVS